MNFRICLFVYFFFLLIFVSFLCLGKYRVEFNGCCSLHISVRKETQISKLNKNMFENKTKTSFLVQRGKLPIFY